MNLVLRRLGPALQYGRSLGLGPYSVLILVVGRWARPAVELGTVGAANTMAAGVHPLQSCTLGLQRSVLVAAGSAVLLWFCSALLWLGGSGLRVPTPRYVWNDQECAKNRPYLCKVSGRYELSRETASWLAARRTCQGMGGDLASVHSQRDGDMMAAVATPTETEVWIGLMDRGAECGNDGGCFRWSDGTQRGEYGAWAAGEPNNNAASSGRRTNAPGGRAEDDADRGEDCVVATACNLGGSSKCDGTGNSGDDFPLRSVTMTMIALAALFCGFAACGSCWLAVGTGATLTAQPAAQASEP